MDRILSYFHISSLSSIKLAHRRNNRKDLEKACNELAVMMIEGDIQFPLGATEPIIAHPPATSDITFREWIQEIIKAKKGAKLDFKDTKTIRPCLEFLSSLKPSIPIILHADVVRGPSGDPVVDANEFVTQCTKLYPEGIISLGFIAGSSNTDIFYTKGMIDEMLHLSHKITQPATYCIRANYLRKSWEQVSRLLQNPKDSITLWNLKAENLPEDERDWINTRVPPSQVIYDIWMKDAHQS